VTVEQLTEKVMKVWEVVHRRSVNGELHLEAGTVATGDAAAIVRSALRHFGTYHTHPVLVRRGDRVFCEDMKLLLYYSNRLRGYGLEREIGPIVSEAA